MELADAIRAGRVDYDWFPLALGRLRIWVFRDALKVDGVRVTVSAEEAQQAADLLGAILPTPKIEDLIFEAAAVRIPPFTGKPLGQRAPKPEDEARLASAGYMWERRHSAKIDAAIDGRDGLVATVGKSWVLSNKLTSERAMNYGWHGGATGPSVSSRTVKVWQTPGMAHDPRHRDYSQTLRLVRRRCTLDGRDVDIRDLLQDPQHAPLLSHEGALRVLRQPGIAELESRDTLPPEPEEEGRVIVLPEITIYATPPVPKPPPAKPPSRTPSGTVAALAGDESGVPFVPARHYRTGRAAAPIWVVIHTAEVGEVPSAAEALQKYAATMADGRVASWHYACPAPEARILGADLIWRQAGDLRVGDRLLATQEHAVGKSGRTLEETEVRTLVMRRAERVRVVLSDERSIVVSTDHRFLGRKAEKHTGWTWLSIPELSEGDAVCVPLTPWEQRNDRAMGYLAGIFDGEGAWHEIAGCIEFSQKDGIVLESARRYLQDAGFRTNEQPRDSGVTMVLISGLNDMLRLLGQARPGRLLSKPRWLGRALRSRIYSNFLVVEAIEPVPPGDVVAFETGTHTYFSEGIVSHNCDNNSITQSVRERDTAFHAKQGNARGIGIELCQRANQTVAQWEDAFSAAVLVLASELCARISQRWSIPVVRLSPQQILDGVPGFCGHVDFTRAFAVKGGHQDPGPRFPWERFIDQVKAAHERRFA